MIEYEDEIVILAPPSTVWGVLATPESWFHGYRETIERSEGYPAAGARNAHVYRTRVDEHVDVHVDEARPPELLVERHEGRSFRRYMRIRLSPHDGGTRLEVSDSVAFKGLARLAAPLASGDVRRRWRASLETLRRVAESVPGAADG